MKITIHGTVQGVGFRPTVYRIATSMHLNGYVQNNGSNVVIEVDRDAEEFVARLRAQLPRLARLDSVEIGHGSNELAKGFRIVHSSSGERGVSIPTDVAQCEECRKEMLDERDRRHLYPFTNCTNCGARFTVIEDLPYDRKKTSLRSFPMCADCRREYEEPGDRRFHHQTICCPNCGPSYYLLDREGSRTDKDPIPEFARLLEEGAIGVAKSWGGMHICCTLGTLAHLRDWYRRKEKPFAVMVRDIEAAKRYCVPSRFEEQLLTSGHRPVVLVPKVRNDVTELISPGLGNVGLFLPYTEMQHLLFHNLKEDALVMTSANIPGEPMVLDDESALGLGAECYLMHDREIINRCDDSVVRSYGKKTFFIRKSRGSVPSSITFQSKGAALAVGAQENITGAIAFGSRIHQTQYIGDGTSYGAIEFLEKALDYHMRLLGVEEIDVVGLDLHPAYTTRRVARALADRYDAETVEVQHHWAHAGALMAEHERDSLVTIAIDGTGYGEDGVAWGGEILDATLESFERIGHLQEVPLLGGEKAVYDVRRLSFAFREALGLPDRYFNEEEAIILRKMTRSSGRTTSFGRVLDAVACELGVCSYRTYDGEPAMKLERALERGRENVPIDVVRDGRVIMTVPMYGQMLDSKANNDDRARSLIAAITRGLVDIAADRAKEHGQKVIGITGGVSYNHVITSIAERMARDRGMRLLVHNELPNGDGCISTGQCAIALRKSGRF
ncbi:MAG TPA: carbamoyltransferase HypF [Methanomassiliicoccales archaeon]|nr:carbamoyltransferase HypF [Methanomassiliicoccales archaeon]